MHLCQPAKACFGILLLASLSGCAGHGPYTGDAFIGHYSGTSTSYGVTTPVDIYISAQGYMSGTYSSAAFGAGLIQGWYYSNGQFAFGVTYSTFNVSANGLGGWNSAGHLYGTGSLSDNGVDSSEVLDLVLVSGV